MSHFSTIKTKLKDRKALLQALMIMGHGVFVDEILENPHDHEHKQWKVDIAIGKDFGFKKNKEGVYELVADVETWNQDVPIERFIDKVSQQYAVEVISRETKKAGWEEESLEVNDKQEIELVVSRWV